MTKQTSEQHELTPSKIDIKWTWPHKPKMEMTHVQEATQQAFSMTWTPSISWLLCSCSFCLAPRYPLSQTPLSQWRTCLLSTKRSVLDIHFLGCSIKPRFFCLFVCFWLSINSLFPSSGFSRVVTILSQACNIFFLTLSENVFFRGLPLKLPLKGSLQDENIPRFADSPDWSVIVTFSALPT